MLRSPLSSPLRHPLQSPLAARRGGVPDPAPPVNVSLPSIMGTPAVGAEVTASPGGWTGYPAISFTYQWRRGGVNISGATAQTYTIQAADYEADLDVVVSATNTEGGPVTATSPAVTVIGVAPVNTVAPVVSGSSGFGDVLTTTNGTWTGYPASFSYAYQWQRNGSNIGGATASTYTIVSGDSAASITCLVTATNAEGSTAQASNGVTAQTFSAPVISGVPTISGTAEVGQLLTASAASVTGNPSPSRTWQWLRDGSSISGATSSTYTLVSADGGTDVSVRQTEANALGFDAEVSAVVEIPASSAFDPATLFGSSEQGGVFDFGDSELIFQSNFGTGAVAAENDPIGYVTDLSGKGNHAVQATAANRLLWRGIPKTLGDELLTNGRFTGDSTWTKGTGWTITAPAATKTAGTASVLSQSVSVVAGRCYQLSYTITRTAGALTPRLTGGTTVSATARSAGGTYTEIIQANTGNVALEFSADASFAGSVSSVTFREVTQSVLKGGYMFGSPRRIVTPTISFSSSDKLTIVFSNQYDQAIASTTCVGVGNWGATAGTAWAGYATTPVGRLRGSSGQNSKQLATADEARGVGSREYVDFHEFDLDQVAQADEISITTGGIVRPGTSSGAEAGAGNLANTTIDIGYASFRGIVSRVIVINRLLTPEEKANAIAWCRQGRIFAATIGDSTVAALSSPLPNASRVSSFVGGLVTGRFDQAIAGYRISNSLADWNAETEKGALQAVFIQIGLNDVKGRVGEGTATTAQVIADLQSLVNTVRSDVPSSCRIYICGLNPCKVWLDAASFPAAAYQAWLDVNEAIAGNGATPINGVDGRVTSHVAALNDGFGNLQAIYDFNNDGVHQSNEARFIVAQAWRAQLEADDLV